MVWRTACSGDNSIQTAGAKAAVALGNIKTGQIVVPQARRVKAGTAAGRSTNVEPTKILFSGDGPALTRSLRLLAQVSNC
jgi:hypothetical protein